MNRREAQELRSNAVRVAAAINAAVALIAFGGITTRVGAQGGATSPSRGTAIATVGGRAVDRTAYERSANQIVSQARAGRAEPLSPALDRLLRRQALEQLIRTQLLILEARRLEVPVSQAEVEAEFRAHPFFQVDGRFDSTRYRSVKAANSAEYRRTLDQIRDEIGGRKLDARLRAEFAPDPDSLRRRTERRLTRADLEYLALRYNEFTGDYPEPSEAEILAYYHAHRRDFSRRERAELSAIEVAVPESRNGGRSARAVADSLASALSSGGSFAAAADFWGGARRRIVVAPGAFPAGWRVDPDLEGMVFKTRPGSTLMTPIEAGDAWMVVRVDEVKPAGPAPLAEVAREIRRILRDRARLEHIDVPLRQAYAERASMLREPAYRVRYAHFDAERTQPRRPTEADLEHYYRSHLADFSAYDPASGTIRTQPLSEVRDRVIAGWRSERQVEDARALSDKLLATWQRGRRDRSLEGRAARLGEPDAVPLGTPVDSGAVGRMLGDSLSARAGALGVGLAPWPGGAVVFHVYERVPDWTPTFESVRPTLEAERARELERQREVEARARFDANPYRFAEGDVIHFTEMVLPFPDALDVSLTRREVEHYHQEHIEDYAAPEEVRVRHILISPENSSPAADAAARRRIEDLQGRLRAGEDFQALARQHSDDPPTRDRGGDVGFFGRGRMLGEFERASFALRPGEISEPVRTEVGYHLIQMIDRIPLSAEPLEHIYANVGFDAATDKAERIIQARADSLRHTLRTPAQARAVAERGGFEILERRMHEGEIPRMPTVLQPYFRNVAALRPGQFLTETRYMKGHGIAIAWLDSIAPERMPQWELARPRVLQEWDAERAERRLAAKRAELDSLAAAGWSVDSLATLWGGLERVTDIAPGRGLPTLGGRIAVDSLAFGGAAPPLAMGVMSDWVDLGRALTRIRVTGRRSPPAEVVQNHLDRERRFALERAFLGYFDRLKGRYPVHIHDRELAETALPLPPPPS